MSGKIDVLAVLDEFALYVRNVSSRHALQGDILEARAAVAELIEVSRVLLTYRVGEYPTRGDLRDNGASRAQLDALATALARVGGAK